MKKFTTLMLLLCTLTMFVGCKKEAVSTEDFIGKWARYGVRGEMQDFEFFEDGTFIETSAVSSGGISLPGKYHCEGNTITLEYDTVDFSKTIEVKFEDGDMIWKLDSNVHYHKVSQ